jgi:hypothetical protein
MKFTIATFVLSLSTVLAQGACVEGPVTDSFFTNGPKGSQFSFGSCKLDSECASGCCGNNFVCRNPPAFNSDSDFCQSGLTVDQASRLAGKGTFFVLSAKAVAAGVCKKAGATTGTETAPPAGGNTGGTGGSANVVTTTVTVTQNCAATPYTK